MAKAVHINGSDITLAVIQAAALQVSAIKPVTRCVI